MISTTQQPGRDIRAGDMVTHRETEMLDRVAALLPLRGGFGDAPWMTGEHTVLLNLASVAWRGEPRHALERTDDLVRVDADRA